MIDPNGMDIWDQVYALKNQVDQNKRDEQKAKSDEHIGNTIDFKDYFEGNISSKSSLNSGKIVEKFDKIEKIKR
ncbi:MAG TPA: hypothetical protein PKD18_17225 [Saprospiraceae bacterium]|nr:hypothetical protein [Saprospiraceae bacterium]